MSPSVLLLVNLMASVLALVGSQSNNAVSRRICELEEMYNGRWVYRNESTARKSFRCCSGEYNDYQDPTLIGFCSANESLLVSGRACYCGTCIIPPTHCILITTLRFLLVLAY